MTYYENEVMITIIGNLRKIKGILEENQLQVGKPKGSNILLLATLPMIPRIVGLEINHYEESLNEQGLIIQQLNGAVKELSDSFGNTRDSIADLSGFGLRKKRLRSGVIRFSYERSSWREPRLELAVHLSNSARVTALIIVAGKIDENLLLLLL